MVRIQLLFQKLSKPVVAFAVGYVILLAGFGFQGVTRPWSEHLFTTSTMTQIQSLVKQLEKITGWDHLPTMLPDDMVSGLDVQLVDLSGKVPTIRFGKWTAGADPWFWWIGLYLKTPPELLILALMGIVLLFRRCEFSSLSMLLIVSLGFIVFATINTGMAYHTRYLYCVIPFVCVLAGVALVAILKRSRWLFGCIATSYLASILWLWPLASTYCNWTIAWSMDHRLMLQDSNLDWGQGWLELHRWMGKHPHRRSFVTMAWDYHVAWLPLFFEVRSLPQETGKHLTSEVLVPLGLFQYCERRQPRALDVSSKTQTICRCFILFENPDDVRELLEKFALIELRRRE